MDNQTSGSEPKWCTLHGALEWVVYGKSPRSPSIEDMALGPPTWPNSAEIRQAKSAILLAIDKRGGDCLDHFIWRINERYPFLFEDDEPAGEYHAAGKMTSVSATRGVNFEKSRHEGLRELGKPQIFVRVFDLKRIFPEPLILRSP